jgi:hypothetical protein
VKEIFRLHAPGPLLIPHENKKACEIGGYHIPAKSHILVNVWAVHRHPSAYENPFDFNPESFVENVIDVKGIDFQLLPFGSGQPLLQSYISEFLLNKILLFMYTKNIFIRHNHSFYTKKIYM